MKIQPTTIVDAILQHVEEENLQADISKLLPLWGGGPPT